MKRTCTILFAMMCLIITKNTSAQNTFPSSGATGIGTTTPSVSSLLEIKSTTKGLLIPRMTQTQKNAVISPVTGLVIYQTDNYPGFYYYDGSAWSIIGYWKRNGTSTFFNTGNVGFGTLSPAYKIDVKGGDINLSAGNYLRVGGIKVFYDNPSSGNNNVFLGDYADTASSPGFRNTAVGSFSMDVNTGAYNTAVGSTSMRYNTTGTSNAAFGEKAMQNNTTGSNNSALGSGALQNNTTSSQNTAVGFQSLYANTAGANTAVGYFSLNANSTGNLNTAIGVNALEHSNANDNSAVGVNALVSNTTGSQNTAIGSGALFDNTTGSNNTAVGYLAGIIPGSGVSNATAIGANARVGQSNSIVLGGTGSNAVNVGIGTTAPQYTLSVNGTIQAKEVRVETGWSDFVFDKNYKLRSLNKVQQYISQNHHLPEMPAASEIQKNGLAVADVQTKMMQKIEELTLYVIQLQKEINQLKSNKNEKK